MKYLFHQEFFALTSAASSQKINDIKTDINLSIEHELISAYGLFYC